MADNVITLIRGKDNDEELQPVFSIYRDRKGTYYAMGTKPNFCIAGNTVDEVTAKAQKALDWYEEDAA